MEQNWSAVLEPIVKEAGAVLLSYYDQSLTRREKEQGGFVTQADIKSEQFLIEQLAKVLPEASFWAEEGGKKGDGAYCWVIDPLDGTTNFAQGIPYFCISVALTYNNVPFVGAIYQPLLDQFFYAQAGKGAFLNGVPIHVSKPESLAKAVVGVGLSYRHIKRKELIHATERVANRVYAIRHFGAIALDLAHVAAGKMDGVFFTHLAWWDVAAGMVLVTEAGGKITDFSGKPLTFEYTTCVAGGSLVYNGVMELFLQHI